MHAVASARRFARGGYGARELVVRVNGLETTWGLDDLLAVATCGAHAVLLPKVDDAAALLRAEAILARSGAPPDLALWCMMETPRGVLNAQAIAAASPRTRCLVMGTSDLAKDLHALHTRDRLPFLTGLGLCLLAARASGLAILDGVHLDLDDLAGFEEQCRQGRALGFDGKTLIHPRTIEAANRIFAPSADEIAWSRRVVAARAEATARGEGVVLVDGKLVETLHVDDARRVLAMADAISAPAAGEKSAQR